jgi:hypothetical protein
VITPTKDQEPFQIVSQILDQKVGAAFSVTVAVLTEIARTSGNVVNIKMIPKRNLFMVPY